jgi:protein SCO1/2
MKSGSALVLRMLLGLAAFALLGLGLLWVSVGGDTRSGARLPVLGQISDFMLTNQFGAVVTLEALRGRVWVADIIFTRCAGPCPLMTRRMAELQAALARMPDVRLVSLTTDPEFDTPAVLREYGDRYGADAGRWMFLTGTKAEIGKLGTAGLKFTALEQPADQRASAEDLFIHSTTFAVVDRQGRLRGVFETVGEGIAFPQVQRRILAAVRRLTAEP